MNRAQVERQGNWLIVRFPVPHQVVSWAIVGGGQTQTHAVAWYRVTKNDLKPPVDPREFLKTRLSEISLPHAVGLLTSADLDRCGDVEKTGDDITVRSIATVGLANTVRIGDPPRLAEPVGTINLLCQISRPLSDEAFLETLSLASEARTTALLESGIRSAETGLAATGTGTDCIVIAAPSGAEPLRYAGKHTLLGHLIGASVLEAVRSGMRK